MHDKLYILKSIHAAIEAGNAILEVYHTDFKVEEKADKSPLTLADRRSHDIIVNRLAKFDIPILSEEGKDVPFEKRKCLFEKLEENKFEEVAFLKVVTFPRTILVLEI